MFDWERLLSCVPRLLQVIAMVVAFTAGTTTRVEAQGPSSDAAGFGSLSQLGPPAADRTPPAWGQHPSRMSYVDLDRQMPTASLPLASPPAAAPWVTGSPEPWVAMPADELWSWQVLPRSIIYPSYLAGQKEPRFAAQIVNAKNDGWLFDASLGTRIGLLRFGNTNSIRPEGWQLDAEGAAQLRLDIPENVDVRAADFRGGVPLTYGWGRYRFKIGFYHLSSHLGDEFLLKNPGFQRLNFSRDVLLVGHMIYLTDELRIYGEAAWAFRSDVTEPWEFQFGVDYLPAGPTGIAGAPFFALNGHIRQELNFGGSVTAQAGWAWRAYEGTHLIRAGLHYFNGESPQYSFFDEHEEQLGFGLWYDF